MNPELLMASHRLITIPLSRLETVAKVVGKRTMLKRWLNFKSCAESRNRVPHEPPKSKHKFVTIAVYWTYPYVAAG